MEEEADDSGFVVGSGAETWRVAGRSRDGARPRICGDSLEGAEIMRQIAAICGELHG